MRPSRAVSVAGECFLKDPNFEIAIQQFEECIPYAHSLTFDRHINDPRTGIVYGYYMEAL
ncbi:MAG: hypothetical protein K2X27_09820 [Candidatus Obscuribacterales bacterium]|nr:hypothetical protein [Candidatus Obscuribacterales bacterium]